MTKFVKSRKIVFVNKRNPKWGGDNALKVCPSIQWSLATLSNTCPRHRLRPLLALLRMHENDCTRCPISLDVHDVARLVMSKLEHGRLHRPVMIIRHVLIQ